MLAGDDAYLVVPNLGRFAIDVSRQREIQAPWLVSGNTVLLSIRPEKIEIRKGAHGGAIPHLHGKVETMVYYGHSTLYHVRVSPECVIRVFDKNEQHVQAEVIGYDDEVCLYWHEKNAVVLER